MLGLGCNTFGLRIGLAETREIVATALDLGVNFFDTADLYGKMDSERFLGQALGARRDEVVIATKWGWTTLDGAPERRALGLLKRETPRGSEPYIRWALDQSLQRLGTDWIDVYQYHKLDDETPLEETFGTLASLVREGKIRWAGLPPLEAREAGGGSRPRAPYWPSARHDPTPVQPRAPRRRARVAPALRAARSRCPPLPPARRWPPHRQVPPRGAASAGFTLRDGLTQFWPRESFLTEEAFDRVEALEAYASERGISLLDVAIGGLIAMPAVGSVIAGATRPEHVQANVRAAQWVPSDEDLAELRALA